MTIICDTRQQDGKHTKKHSYLVSHGHTLKLCKLPVGDYALYDSLPDDIKKRIDNMDLVNREKRELTSKEKTERAELSKELLKHLYISVDTKQNLTELVGNAGNGHKRFSKECSLATNEIIKLTILCEHSPKIKTLDDVKEWYNPRLKKSPYAISGRKLHKILSTISLKYGTEFIFCSKAQTGEKIIELLSK